ncbi:TetR/AcrR family transcriptional regulator [Saccharopolyspora rhizosphaerae]|uniref:TetR/AcrR family transcriptional regulator n=1 Tax=Saccharopolyspora rhizosphaerae TaxID=2492662 RepID=A0A426JWF5_9PSEU|nr:TetR/AcrR family transcriptional regulator [Saccharopolyspora rhizosphaerae]RRO17515.1 TetR/AcrR family transcriptional regulator [Saccharopolyspora rhizosphaerae]
MTEPVRQFVEGRRADTVRRLLDATVEELVERGFGSMTVRSVAERAAVSRATAYSYFSSKEHLVTAVFWKRVQALPPSGDARTGKPGEDVARAVDTIAQMLAAESALVQACTTALLADQQEVKRLRDEIGREVYRRLADAVGDADPSALDAVMTAFVGSLVLAGSGYLPMEQLASHLAGITDRVLPPAGS